MVSMTMRNERIKSSEEGPCLLVPKKTHLFGVSSGEFQVSECGVRGFILASGGEWTLPKTSVMGRRAKRKKDRDLNKKGGNQSKKNMSRSPIRCVRRLMGVETKGGVVCGGMCFDDPRGCSTTREIETA